MLTPAGASRVGEGVQGAPHQLLIPCPVLTRLPDTPGPAQTLHARQRPSAPTQTVMPGSGPKDSPTPSFPPQPPLAS